jgi:hypothetical protein
MQEMRPPRDAGSVVPIPLRQDQPLPPLRKFSSGEVARRRSHRPDVQEPAELHAKMARREYSLVSVLPSPVLRHPQESAHPQAEPAAGNGCWMLDVGCLVKTAPLPHNQHPKSVLPVWPNRMSEQSAIHPDRLTGDELGAVARQERDRPRHVQRLSNSA